MTPKDKRDKKKFGRHVKFNFLSSHFSFLYIVRWLFFLHFLVYISAMMINFSEIGTDRGGWSRYWLNLPLKWDSNFQFHFFHVVFHWSDSVSLRSHDLQFKSLPVFFSREGKFLYSGCEYLKLFIFCLSWNINIASYLAVSAMVKSNFF